MQSPGGAAMTLPNTFQTAPDGTLMFPRLPGMTLQYTMRPTFSTIVQTAPDRSTTRIGLDPYPLWQYDLNFEYIADDPDYNVPDETTNPANLTQLQQILGLFLACGGQRDTFLMDLSLVTKKASDNAVAGVPVGTGDGATLAFQLVRPVGGFLDLIDNPVEETVELIVTPNDGSAAYAPPIDSQSNGLVSLIAAPPAGAAVTASFSWLHRMRFASDTDDIDGMLYLLFSHGALKLTQERNQAE